MGTPGSASERVAVVRAMQRNLPSLTNSISLAIDAKLNGTWPPSRSALKLPLYGTCTRVGAGHHLEQFAGGMWPGANALGRKIDLARMGFGISDEFGDRFRRKGRICDNDEGRNANAGDGAKSLTKSKLSFE